MKNLLLKDLKKQVLLLFPIYLVMIAGGVFAGNLSGGLLNAFVISFFIIFTVLLGITSVEYNEDKNDAYSFFETLPLTKRGIVTVKFLEILLLDISVCLISFIILHIIIPANTYMEASGMIVAVSFGTALSISAIYYAGVYAFGFDLFNKISISVLLLGQGIAVYFQFLRMNELKGTDTADIALFFESLDLAAVLGIPLFIYLVLLIATVKVRRKT